MAEMENNVKMSRRDNISVKEKDNNKTTSHRDNISVDLTDEKNNNVP